MGQGGDTRPQSAFPIPHPALPRQVSLSSMWAVQRCESAGDFVRQALDLGFTHIEANYQLTPRMVSELLALPTPPVLSVHSPCPSQLVREGLWSYKIPLNAPDPAERALALGFAESAIELAARLHARAVVLHLGEVPQPPIDGSAETLQAKLRWLYQQGAVNTPEYAETRAAMFAWRDKERGPHLELAAASLRVLAKKASELGLILGLETRYYFHEIPNYEEMGWLLSEYPVNVVGYWHDVGHAENLERLGSTLHERWLASYADRMVGVHIHDINVLKDHHAPGTGNLDYSMIARHLPPQAIRVCEIDTRHDPELLRAGLRRLTETGIIAG